MAAQEVERIEYCGGLSLPDRNGKWLEMDCEPMHYERLLLPFVGREVEIQVAGPTFVIGLGVLRELEVEIDEATEDGHHGSLRFRFVVSERAEREQVASQSISVVASKEANVSIGDEGEIEFIMNSGELRISPMTDLPLAEGLRSNR